MAQFFYRHKARKELQKLFITYLYGTLEQMDWEGCREVGRRRDPGGGSGGKERWERGEVLCA